MSLKKSVVLKWTREFLEKLNHRKFARRVIILLILVYTAIVLLANINPAHLESYQVSLIIQGVTLLFLIVREVVRFTKEPDYEDFTGSSARSPMSPLRLGRLLTTIMVGGLLIVYIVRLAILTHNRKTPIVNLEAKYVRWDSFMTEFMSLAFYGIMYWGLCNPTRTQGTIMFTIHTMLFILLGLVIIFRFRTTFKTTIPSMLDQSNPDQALLETTADLSDYIYSCEANGVNGVTGVTGLCKQEFPGAKQLAHFDTGTAEALVLRSTDGNTLYVVFKGTDTLDQIKTDFNFLDAEYDKARIPGKPTTNPTKKIAESLPTISVHKGFNTSLDKICDTGLWNAIVQHSTETLAQRIVLTGHSLGGCQATLLAPRVVAAIQEGLVGTLGTRLDIYTFGSPQVGDGIFVKFFNETVPNSFRIVNPSDPMPDGLSSQLQHVHGYYAVGEWRDLNILHNAHRFYTRCVRNPRYVVYLVLFIPILLLLIALLVLIGFESLTEPFVTTLYDIAKKNLLVK
jgi:hypothetical protein